MSAKIPTIPKKPEAGVAAAVAAAPVSAYVAVGKVGKAHGLRGAFFVAQRDEPIPKSYGELWIGPDPGLAQPVRVRASHMQADRPLLLCSLADNRSAAEALIGQWIYAERSRIKVKQDEILWSDLIGAAVVASDGIQLGRIEQVYNAGSCDIASLKDGAKTLDIPLVDSYLRPDQAFDAAAQVLHLQVPAEVFAELWQDAAKVKATPAAVVPGGHA